MTDLDKLRELAGMVPDGWDELCHEAANELEQLRRRVELHATFAKQNGFFDELRRVENVEGLAVTGGQGQ